MRAKPPVELTVLEPAAGAAASPDSARAAPALKPERITRQNALTFHQDGEAAFADVISLIDNAKRSIDIQTYTLKADSTGTALLERLMARAKEGVEVRLLIDGYGSFHMSRWPLRKLRRAGGKVAYFLPIWRITLLNRSNLRNHRKIAIFDQERVFAGGETLLMSTWVPSPTQNGGPISPSY